MIPIKDNIKTTRIPVVNYILIASNILIFFYEFSLGSNLEPFILEYGLIPSSVTSFNNTGIYERTAPFITSMFLHGGWLHLIGNMLFLHIFGDNIEDRMGHFKFLLFYLITGIIASLFQVITNFRSDIPMVGASGAISGVLGAYLVFFPHSRVLTLVPIFFFIRLMYIPATVFIVIWFFIQFVSGIGSIGISKSIGGIAFWAHIGGFIAGLILARVFDGRKKRKVFKKEYLH